MARPTKSTKPDRCGRDLRVAAFRRVPWPGSCRSSGSMICVKVAARMMRIFRIRYAGEPALDRPETRVLQSARQALALAKGEADAAEFRIHNPPEQIVPIKTSAERERRRKMVRSVFRSNALEGLRPNPACQPAFDAYISGEISLEELRGKINAILGIGKPKSDAT